MKFPLPNVSEEDRGLLRDVRAKRKYEKKKKYPVKNIKNEEGNSSYCMVTITAIGGAIIIIATIIFTVLEVMNNKNTVITAYPMDYHKTDDGNINILQKNPNYVYPRISLDEVRAEIERSRIKETAQSAEMIKTALKVQQSWIAQDFPANYNKNTLQDLIGSLFNNTEFYRRFRTEGDTEWTLKLSSSRAIYDEALYDTLPICIHITNRQNGYGFRNWRDGQVHYQTEMMSCTIGIHWGWITMCPSPKEGAKDVYNIFEVLFYNNYDFAASHIRYNTFSNTQKYPPLHSYNVYFAGRGHVMYDLYGPFINGSVEIIENANNNILLKSSKGGGMEWPKKANKYDKELNIVGNITMNDNDIDLKFGNAIGWDGGINIMPVLNYYGLMVQHLRYKYRKIIVDYIENNWKDKFIISYHLQTGNRQKNNFGGFEEQIINSLKYLLNNDNDVISIQNAKTIVYISTDCGNGDELTNFIDIIKEKVNAMGIDILLREQERTEQGKGHPMDNKYEVENIEKCIEIFGNIQIDAELLGLSDILFLPSKKGKYGSSYTRLSRALMMKRHKIICKCIESPKKYLCKNFETKQSVTMNL